MKTAMQKFFELTILGYGILFTVLAWSAFVYAYAP